jgi:hypothetical protein
LIVLIPTRPWRRVTHDEIVAGNIGEAAEMIDIADTPRSCSGPESDRRVTLIFIA